MAPQYKINLIDHERWISTGYKRPFSWGLVLDEKGRELGFWRIARYNPNSFYEGGCYEFSLEKNGPAVVSREFALLDIAWSRGRALSGFVADILDWSKDHWS